MRRFNHGKNKYGAKKVVLDGITFDSQKEARRWAELRLLQKAGEIADLERQVRIDLMGQYRPILTPTGRQMRYVADFTYTDLKTGCTVIEDAKGFKTKEYLIKKAILAAMGIDLLET